MTKLLMVSAWWRTFGVKIEASLKKLEKLDVIELQLKEVHAKVASTEDSVTRLDSEVHVLKTRLTTKLEKNPEELEEGFQYLKMMALTFNGTTRNWSMRFNL